MDTIDKINDIRLYLQNTFKERTDVIEGLLTALVAQVHVLLIGAPGTAKSAITVTLASLIEGFDYYQWLMTKFTTPEELFGPYDLQKLKAGTYERITAGRLPVAHMAYLDELFKANSAILNALLTLINERVFYNGTRKETSPLQMLIGTSNEYPQEEELQALFDRFLLRYEPGYIKEDGNFVAMLMHSSEQPPAPITAMELEQLQQESSRMPVESHVVDAIVTLRADLVQEGIVLSDRRWVQVTKRILPARAVLAGRRHIVIEEDAEILQHVLWEDPSQKATVAMIVRKRLDPVAGQVSELLEDARDIANTAMKASDEQAVPLGTEAIKNLKSIRSEVQSFIGAGGTPAKRQKIQEADAKIEEFLKGVTRKCLGI